MYLATSIALGNVLHVACHTLRYAAASTTVVGS